jgi:hypothetical protein
MRDELVEIVRACSCFSHLIGGFTHNPSPEEAPQRVTNGAPHHVGAVAAEMPMDVAELVYTSVIPLWMGFRSLRSGPTLTHQIMDWTGYLGR